MRKGTLYGIGTGPGDPELLTLKALRIIEACHVIALPRACASTTAGKKGGTSRETRENRERTAFQIVEKYLVGKPLLECAFSMEPLEENRKILRRQAADDICKQLEAGKDVGFITLGDPTIYSTYLYLQEQVAARGFPTQIIPGIPSFVAAAATLNTSLCEGEEALHILPASDLQSIDHWLSLPGNKVFMKSGKSLSALLSALEQRGLSSQTQIVERCTLPGEGIFHSIAEFQQASKGDAGYFTLAILKEDPTHKETKDPGEASF